MAIPESVLVALQQSGLKVRGAWVDQGDWTHRFSHQHHWKFAAITSGELGVTSITDNWTLQANHGVLFAPGDHCRVHAPAATTCVHVLFSAITAPQHQAPWQQLQLPAISTCDDVSPLQQLAELYDGKKNCWRQADGGIKARMLFDQFLWHFIRHGFAEGNITSRIHRPTWLQQTIDAARSACRQPDFGVADFVKLAGCSHGHLCRSLQQSDQLTPQALLHKLRTDQAHHMLQHQPDISLDVLVKRCGFRTSQQLRRQFKAITGITIRQARTAKN